MPELLEGSQAVARAVGLARPQVVCAYPISPQTHIVEALSGMVRTGKLTGCEYINVESEFGAMSVSIGSSAAGARTYTATASQGLLYMVEAVYNASGLGLPIVMTVASRAIGAPINIWNDQSDSLSQRDSGWLQLFAVDNQEALDLHIQAFKIAESLSIPVMVCMDGFVLTHASDVVEIPSQEEVDSFLPRFEPREQLDLKAPKTIGMMAGPETFTETKYIAYREFCGALKTVKDVGDEYRSLVGRQVGGLAHVYDSQGYLVENPEPANADDLVVITMGSIIGTLRAILPTLAAEGIRIRLIAVTSFRPFPEEYIAKMVGGAKRLIVLDRAVQLGIGGILGEEIRRALRHQEISFHSVAAGLGGRPITEHSLLETLRTGARGELPEMSFMDLRTDVVGQVS